MISNDTKTTTNKTAEPSSFITSFCYSDHHVYSSHHSYWFITHSSVCPSHIDHWCFLLTVVSLWALVIWAKHFSSTTQPFCCLWDVYDWTVGITLGLHSHNLKSQHGKVYKLDSPLNHDGFHESHMYWPTTVEQPHHRQTLTSPLDTIRCTSSGFWRGMYPHQRLNGVADMGVELDSVLSPQRSSEPDVGGGGFCRKESCKH